MIKRYTPAEIKKMSLAETHDALIILTKQSADLKKELDHMRKTLYIRRKSK